MSHEPLDLSPLDATLEGERFERLVAATMQRVRPELERRALPSPWRMLVGWTRPTLAAATLAAVVSAVVLGGPRAEGDEVGPQFLTSDASSLSALLDDWLIEARTPTANEMMVALTGELMP